MDIPKVSRLFSIFKSTSLTLDTVRYNNIKYLTHRITYQQHHNDIIIGNGMDISHTLYIGKHTSK